MTIILGIDPGVQNMAFAVLDTKEQKIIKHKVHSWGESYVEVMTDVYNLLDKYKVDAVAIEKPFFRPRTLAKNIRTLELIGVIKVAIDSLNENYKDANVKITEYAPSEIKKAFTGKGNADKDFVISRAKELFGFVTETSHEADAIAVAVTHDIKTNNRCY